MIKVNDREISERDFDMACMERKYVFRKEKLEKADIEEVTDILIDAVLMLEQAEKENIEYDAAEVDATISKMKKSFKTEDDFLKALSKTGDNNDSIKERIARNLKLRNFVQKKFIADTVVSDDDLNKYYENYPERFNKGEEVRASHILFGEGDKEQALEIHEQLLNGADFTELAKNHSQCPSGQNGGDLGYFDKGKMVPEFEQAAFEMETGEISDLVQTQFGYHIIKLTDRRTGGKFELNEIKEQLRQSMANSILNHKIKSYTVSLREKADIVIDRDKLEARINAAGK
ncbi:MAG TPA: peptidylprolyl isomerase [Clostridiales bacterium]|nr:peptidylprolyl isomerase [Clostridiales bacterium]HQP69489.1 peptidylprolyl isomerase [Clostridiales bacterium]